MSVKIRQYKRRGRLTGAWEVDIMLLLPNGKVIRERKISPLPSKGGTKFWADQRCAELLKGTVLNPEAEVPKFGEFFERFLEGQSRANREKPSSIDSKQRIWRNYLQPRFKNTRLNEITTEEVQALKGHMASNELSAKTVNNALSLLNGLLKAAHEWRIIKELPVRVRMLKVKSSEVVFYEPSQYERLITAAHLVGHQAETVVLLGGDAGLRTGEMLGLKWTDIDFDKGSLTINRSIWRGHTTLPKSGKPRTVPMTHRLADCLRRQRHLAREEVLYRQGAEQATRSCVNKWLMQAERRAGLEAVGSLHRLRHTFCSRLARQGAPAAAIQALAGHSSYATTARYVHLFAGDKENAIRLLEQGNTGGIVEALPETAANGGH